MGRPPHYARAAGLILGALALTTSGCRLAPREQVEECHRLSVVLRSENARLKDQVQALRSQNRDLSERAVDDGRTITQLEETNRQLETSVQAYQDERSQLESAYRAFRASLPGISPPLSMEATPPPATAPGHDAAVRRAGVEESGAPAEIPAAPPRKTRKPRPRGRTGWAPSKGDPDASEAPDGPGDP
jgi:hypothetical protein